MPRVKVQSILGGRSPSTFFFSEGQYLESIGIDPDLPITDDAGDKRTSGIIRPSAYTDFSGAEIDDNVYWLLTNPKDSKVYAYLGNGDLVSYSSSLGSETAEGTANSSSGNGAAYYNNFHYLATDTDVARFGPLDGTPSMLQAAWTGGTFSQTALNNTTYPSIKGSGTIPNHPMHVHVDNQLYLGDVSSDGKGIIHAIKTKKTTDQGDADDGSDYNVLDLPFDYYPMCISSYGKQLAIGASPTTDGTTFQGNAKVFLWDTTSDSFYEPIKLPDSLVTAMIQHEGVLYIFSGEIEGGYRVNAYRGGKQLQQLYYSNVGSPPLQGAVEVVGDKIVWGTHHQIETTNSASPDHYASCFSLRSKDNRLPGGIHGIINSTATATSSDGLVTSLKRVQQDSLAAPQFIVGHRDASGQGIDKRTTSTYGKSIWRSHMIQVGQRFSIQRIRILLTDAVGANHIITPKVYLDNFSSSSTSKLTKINNTNYSGERFAEYRPQISGDYNFCLELEFTGTDLIGVMLPIIIDFQLLRD